MNVVLLDRQDGQVVGGIGVFTERFFDFLKKQGHTVHILRYTKQPVVSQGIIPVPYLFSEPRTFVWIPSCQTFSTIKKALRALHPDVVYMGLPLSTIDLIIPSLCHRLGIPIAGVWHSDFHSDSRAMQKMTKTLLLFYLPLCRQLDLLHVLSDEMKQFYVSKGIREKAIVTIPNGVDSDYYTPGPSRFAKQHQIQTGILFLGRMTLWKNPEMILRAFLQLRLPDRTKLVMVGPGDLEGKLKKTYTDPRIIFTGRISDEETKRDVIRSCQIFALPSRVEGISLSLLEAMSCGLVPVITDVGAHRQVVGDSGIILGRPHWEEDLITKLQELLSHPQKRLALGKKARDRVVNQYHLHSLFRTLEEALRQCAIAYQARTPVSS